MRRLVVFYEPGPTVEQAMEGLSATTYDSPAQAAAAEEWDEDNPLEYTLGVFQAASGITDRSVALWKLHKLLLKEMGPHGEQG